VQNTSASLHHFIPLYFYTEPLTISWYMNHLWFWLKYVTVIYQGILCPPPVWTSVNALNVYQHTCFCWTKLFSIVQRALPEMCPSEYRGESVDLP